MTFRAVLLALLAVVALCAFTYFNDFVVRQTFIIRSYMPVAIFGGFVLFLMLVNPLLGRIRSAWALSAAELALILSLVLAACFIPAHGLMHHFTRLLMQPHYTVQLRPDWSEQRILERVPDGMLADPHHEREDVLLGFMMGLGEGRRHIALHEVPWFAYSRPLRYWIPIILSLNLAVLGLALVVHRQWSRHEHLPYPVVQFANALLPQSRRSVPAVFRQRLFWIGAATIFTVLMSQFLYLWYPRYVVPVRTSFNLTPLGNLWSTFMQGGGGALVTPKVFFAALGLAYFLARDVSFSVGVAPFVYAVVAGALAHYGVSFMGRGRNEPNIDGFIFVGSYFGVVLMMLYTGRRYYGQVLRASVGLRSADKVGLHAVWGARLFCVGTFYFMVRLAQAGIPWSYVLPYTFGTFMTFVVVSRVVAETGVFYLKPYFYPCIAMLGFLGPRAIDPDVLLAMLMFSTMFLVHPAEAAMPFFAQGLRLAEERGIQPGRLGLMCVVVMVLGLAVAIPATLYWQYDRGALATDDGWCSWVSQMPFDATVWVRQRLEAQNVLASAGHCEDILQWMRSITPNLPSVWAFAVSFVLVVVFSFLRLRCPRWPLHPVMFVVSYTYCSKMLAASFLAGWIIKAMVSRYGGPAACEKVKPLMIGLIAGEMLAGAVTMIIGTCYYLVSGFSPPGFRVAP